MSGGRRTGGGCTPPCDAPNAPHALTRARLYPAGWLCGRHAPWAIAGRAEPGVKTRAGPEAECGISVGRPA